jgi:two-component system, NarL family, invasion response regulator UvrY
MIRVIVADDHPIVRQGIQLTLQNAGDVEVVEEATNGEEALQKVRRTACDVMILDISLPLLNGLDVLKTVRAELPALPVLIMSAFPERQYAVRCLRAGAAGYLTKDSAPTELIQAIRKVVDGRKYVSASLAEKLAAELSPSPERLKHESLSDREFQVMMLIARGKKISHIAHELSISVPTANTYRARVLDKLSVENNAEIVHYAVSNRLIDLGDAGTRTDD